MTGQPLIRYHCDRCSKTDEMDADNRPPQERIAGPQGWTLLRIGTDATTPPSHLCPNCTMLFNAFMQGVIQ